MTAKDKRLRSKARREQGRFIAIPCVVMDSTDYRKLSPYGTKLLFAIAYQFNGRNNGDLNCSFTVMKLWGFKSKTTLHKAKEELLIKNFIIETRAGRFLNPGGVCSLYALTWQAIDECNGKHDLKPTNIPPRNFSLERHKKQQNNTFKPTPVTD